MKTLAKETARLVESLPPDKAEAVLDYARYLAEKADDAEWERLFASPKHRRKFKALINRVDREIAKDQTQEFDFRRL